MLETIDHEEWRYDFKWEIIKKMDEIQNQRERNAREACKKIEIINEVKNARDEELMNQYYFLKKLYEECE